MERIKRNLAEGSLVKPYFWRSYGGAEVDYIEVGEGKIMAWELKSGERAGLSRGAGVFAKEYGVGVSLVNGKNYLDEFLKS